MFVRAKSSHKLEIIIATREGHAVCLSAFGLFAKQIRSVSVKLPGITFIIHLQL